MTNQYKFPGMFAWDYYRDRKDGKINPIASKSMTKSEALTYPNGKGWKQGLLFYRTPANDLIEVLDMVKKLDSYEYSYYSSKDAQRFTSNKFTLKFLESALLART